MSAGKAPNERRTERGASIMCVHALAAKSQPEMEKRESASSGTPEGFLPRAARVLGAAIILSLKV
jgi:hypothetical protein